MVRSLDMRYAGQSYELNVPWSERAAEAFHRLHRLRYGVADPKRPVEVVTARLRGIGMLSHPALPREEASGEDPAAARVGERDVHFRDGTLRTPVYCRDVLRAGNRINGPAIIVEYTATSLVPRGFWAGVDAYRNLLIEEGG